MDRTFAVNLVLTTILLFVALVLATKFGFLYCGSLPMWCEGYRAVMSTFYQRNYPAVLVLYGDDGLGDPEGLYKYLRYTCRLYAEKRHVDTVGPGNLERFDAVIVTHARTLSAAQTEMLWDFVASGGKLVLEADSGTGTDEPSEYVTEGDLGREGNGVYNYWDRKKDNGTLIPLGTQLLGLKYVGMHCEECNALSYSGTLVVERDVFTKGVPREVPLYSNYAVTTYLGTSIFGPQTMVAVVDNTGKVGDESPPYPAIVRVGYRIVYSAFPLEYLVSPPQAESAPQAALILRNMCEWLST